VGATATEDLADLYPAIRARSIAEQECSEEVIAAIIRSASAGTPATSM
jgi:hypothetical protein